MLDKDLSEAERQAVFLALVEAQDAGMAATPSREAMAKRFAISTEQVRAIERGGSTVSGHRWRSRHRRASRRGSIPCRRPAPRPGRDRPEDDHGLTGLCNLASPR